MESLAYLLCVLTALSCGALLLNRYRRVRVSLLLWCGVFFLALAVENAILFVDRVIFPDANLSICRNSVALLGLVGLLLGLIADTR